MHQCCNDRRGISLMEVLISIGILSIGLLSVLALIPAGRSQMSKASSLDRTTSLAVNAAADFINRGFARPAGWTNSNPGTRFVVFDPMESNSFWPTATIPTISPRIDAATTGTGAAILFSGTAATAVAIRGLLMRSEDDLRYSADPLGEDDLPVPKWSVSGSSGRHAFDGAYSYLATLSGTSSSWTAGEYKTLTIVTFARRDTSVPPIALSPTTAPNADGSWTVDKTNLPDDSALKDLVKPGAMILFKSSDGFPAWYRVLLASDMTDPAASADWKLGLTCENGDPATSNVKNLVYLFPGAVGSTQLLIRLEGTNIWNDR